jgi:nucleoside triphosphate diphosphatase
MIRRHPHVFGAVEIDDAEAQTQAWEEQKAAERAAKAAESGDKPSALDGVSVAYPALMRALKLQRQAARVGFDWPETAPVIDKIHEELGELTDELAAGSVNADAVEDEMSHLRPGSRADTALAIGGGLCRKVTPRPSTSILASG